MVTDRDLEDIHKLTIRHRPLVEASERCGCFYCCSIFPATEIKDWVDGEDLDTGVTALCPRCGIDSVLPQPPVPVTPELLAHMRQVYF
jgi:hypothetical protein